MAVVLWLGTAQARDELGADAAASPAHPDPEGIKVLTPDGRAVLLKGDHTWIYLEDEPASTEGAAVMAVANVQDATRACKIGFRLTNNLGYQIRSLVPSFSAYTAGGVRYETVSKSFHSIKPTRDQYQQIRFNGIQCDDIEYVLVHGADRCNMGVIDKFNEEQGECLSLITVLPSTLIKVTK
ncbi:MAG TPA: hypothetical protein ENJ19_01980 [Gammaproteobacteria bacterium]|nr:hypothetical protein [Gammaproteobacteria bacterium]